MKLHFIHLRALFALTGAWLLAISSQAATYTWSKAVTDGTNLSTNWTSAANWSALPVSAADTTLVFGYTWTTNSTARTNTLTNDVANPFLLNVLTLGVANPTAGSGSSVALINIAGSPLEFVSNGGTTPQVNLNQNRSAGQVVSFDVQSNIVLTNDTLFTGNGTANFTFSGGISGAGILTKSGTSALTLSGAISSTGGLAMNGGSLTLSNASNSYIGGTSISSGTLIVTSTGTLGQNINTNNISLAAGARLDLTAAGNTGANQTITLTSTAGSLATLALGYNGVPNATIEQADTNGGLIAINGVTGFTGNLSTILTGKNLFLGGIGTSTFTGAAATLAAGNGNIYRLGGGGGSISFNTANQLTGANSVQIGSTATGGTGTVIFGAAQDYSGGTSITTGSTLRFDTRLSMPASGTVTVNDGATLAVTVAGTGTTWGGGTAEAGIAGLTSTANSGEGFGGQTGAVVNFNGNSSLNLNVTGNVIESNVIGNGTATSIRLVKSGTSTLTLSGDNTYSGGTSLTAGALALGHNNALGSGTLTISGGTTIQSNDATARTLSNAVTISGDFTVGGTGNLTFSNTGASALGATRQITVATGVNATFAQAFSGATFGITKAGAGTLTLSGNNSYTGVTTINAGTVVLNNGGDVTGSAVTFGASNTGLTVTGGSGVSSIWNANGGNIATGNGAYNNVQMLIDGAGTAGSARVINVGTLIWGRTVTASTLSLTDGGEMTVNGEIRIGNPYYSETGGANLTIGGGTATSTFSGNNPTTSNDFYIGYGERTGSKNNVVTVNSGGVLTSIRDMYVGHVNQTQNNDNPTTNNQLLVTGTGTASMRGISVGYANADTRDATSNVVSVTGGGQLSSTGAVYVGRAANATSTSNANTLTISGVGSSWNAGNQTVYVGHTNNGTASSNNNILTVGAGASVTNIGSLIVGFGTGTETGNQLVVNGNLTATTVTVNAGNSLSGSGTINGAVTVNGNYLPGQSPGTMTFQNTLTLTSTSASTIEIDGNNGAGVTGGHDFTNLTGVGAAGVLTYGGAMTLDIGAVFGAGVHSWNLFDMASESGTFASITLADQYSGSLLDADLDGVWDLTSGNDTWVFTESTGVLGLTVIPEPKAALLGALGILLLLRRRRL